MLFNKKIVITDICTPAETDRAALFIRTGISSLRRCAKNPDRQRVRSELCAAIVFLYNPQIATNRILFRYITI